MDPKCLDDAVKQSTSSVSIECKPNTFAARGIFQDGLNFLCLVCNKFINDLNMIPTHIVGPRHCYKLEEAYASYAKVDGQFTCKLCENYVAADWKAYLCHFNEKKHFEESHDKKMEASNKNSPNSDSLFSYITLILNQIIEYEFGTFFCCCCKKFVVGKDAILQHISEKMHVQLQQANHNQKSIGYLKENESARFVRNCLFHVSLSTFYCNLCNCSICGIKNCWEHVHCNQHKQNIIIKENTNHQSLFENFELNENSQIPSLKLSKVEIPESFAELICDNSITGPLLTGEYHCKLCGCMLSGQINIMEHVSGKQHRKLMQKDGKELTSATATATKRVSEGSSSSWETIDNSSESWEGFVCGSQSGVSYENSSYTWESSDNISDSWETLSIQGSSSESLGSTLFTISPNLMPLISKHFLHHLKKELFCELCDAHLRSEQCLINHTRSKHHLAALKKYKAQIAKKNNKLSVTSKKKQAANLSVNAINNKPTHLDTKYETGTENQKYLTEKAESPQSMPFKIPKNLIPLISEHLLQQRMKELYCKACQAHLQNLEGLVGHTKSKYHVARLNDYKVQIAKQNKASADTSGRNSTLSSVSSRFSKNKVSKSVNTNNEVSVSSQKVVTKESQPTQPKLFKIPHDIIPILSEHSLQHLTYEIFCQACRRHLRHVNTLREHIYSKNHKAELKKYIAKIRSSSESSAEISKTNAAANFPFNVKKSPGVRCRNNATTLKTITSNPETCPKSVTHTNMETQIYSPVYVGGPRSELKLIKETPMTKAETNLKQITNVSESETGLEESVKKLTIVKEKGQNSKKLPQKQSKKFSNGPPEPKGPRKQDGRPIKNRAFNPKYLNANMQHIYELNPEKLKTIKLSCQLCFPITYNIIYCLICGRSVANKLQTFYEHICSDAHIIELTETEKNDKYFVNHPDQFSDLALAKEFMQEGQYGTIQCFACNAFIQNDDAVILEHTNKDSHRKRKQLWNEGMEKILQDILVEMKSTWYNIQKYWCFLCYKELNTEFNFAKHMDSKKHKRSVTNMAKSQKRLIYDSCTSCAMLWLGLPEMYTHHCKEPMHKYLVHTGDFSVCKLPYQAVALLKNAVAEVTNLIELSDQVLTIEKVKADTLIKCLEDTVRPLFTDAKAYPFGSRVSGLGFPDSDIDVFLNCGTYDGNNNTKEYQNQLIKSVAHCLEVNQQSWEIEETLLDSRTPIIKLRHRETELRCDVSFKNGLSVENTKLLKCFIDNYPPCRKLMLFLKRWLSLCNLSGSQYITNYATCWYIIFYLQSRLILPSVASLITKENKSKLIDRWETGISETFNVDEKELTFLELLHGFFVFYSNFDYRNSVACPIIGRTILKQDFTDLDLLPKEMAPYVNYVVSGSVDGPVDLFRIDSEMCIQDPYDLSHNLTKAVRKFTLNRFMRLCAASADVLNNFIHH